MTVILVSDFLNQLLATKPFVETDVEVEGEVTVNVPQIRPGTSYRPGNNTYTGEIDTISIRQPVVRRLPRPAVVKTESIVNISDLLFDDLNRISLPEKTVIRTFKINNNSAVSFERTVNASLKLVTGWRATKSRVISTTSAAKYEASGSFFGLADSGFELSWSQRLDVSSGNEESSSAEQNIAISDKFNVPERTSVEIDFFAYEQTVKVPFSASVLVDGELRKNYSGVVLASDLLSPEERTIKISGFLEVTGASETNVNVREIQIAASGN